jgi:hypothetical protein
VSFDRTHRRTQAADDTDNAVRELEHFATSVCSTVTDRRLSVVSHKGFRSHVAIAPVAAATVAALAQPAIAQADPNDTFRFQTPSGNIACYLGPAERGGTNGFVACEIGDYTYSAPPRPLACHLARGGRFKLAQGGQPELACPGDTMRSADLPTLDYGETAFSGAIRCSIEQAGIICNDTSTGHFFRLSRESYELG